MDSRLTTTLQCDGTFKASMIASIRAMQEELLGALATPGSWLPASRRAASYALLTRLVRSEWELISPQARCQLLDLLAVELMLEASRLVRSRIHTAISALIHPPLRRSAIGTVARPSAN